MNNSKEEERLKIAVFIDFDNIAIGVKQSLSRNFDVGTVLEAIKEKGQVVTKIAYGDWKRNEDFSRAMTQHAVQMVQRNLTPGGDKNGADIALALDALEMAFTRDHINAFVIVGGDSDFIALVEKLKQYDKVVFVVGGRAFTSVILQKNCHEFISYENLIGVQSGIKRSTGKSQGVSSPASLETALPLIRRSLKILSDREVSPQLGLLKSTLLQLDSTFSERDYGVSSFRDFTQKLANAGYVNLKQVDRSLLVELKEIPESNGKTTPEPASSPEQAPPEAASPADPSTIPIQPSEATRALQELIRGSKAKPNWPMYLRTFKQFLKSLQPPFDEHQFGITSTYDLVRQAQKDGLLRIERNRQGIMRIYPAELFPQTIQEAPAQEQTRPSASESVIRQSEPKKPDTADTKPEETAPKETESEEKNASEKAKTRKTRSVKTARKSTKTSKARTTRTKTEPPQNEPESVGKEPAREAEEIAAEIKPESAPEKEPETQPETETETPVEKPAPKRKRKTTAAKTTRTRKTTARKTNTRKTKTTRGKTAKEESRQEGSDEVNTG
ncbi:MAG: NYN domain-containing protein [Acidobacteria bacterium]|nr:NYN domain-containing protein [Acidobacteriota bacterium]